MTNLYEALKGFTDIPLCLVSLIFGFLLIKKDRKSFGIMFLIISAAALLGTIVHCIEMPEYIYTISWIVLYVLLFEAVRRFALLAVNTVCRSLPEKKTVYALETVLYLVTVFGLIAGLPFNEILIFIFFSAIMIVRLVVAIIKNPPLPKLFIALLIFIVLPVLLQAGESFIPYAVVMEHAAILIAMFITYLIGKAPAPKH